MSSEDATALFVENALAALLRAPHITVPPHAGIGPIDIFSTDFENTFTADARGAVDGVLVDRDELKEKLLALQTHYNPDTVEFHICADDDSDQDFAPDEVRLSFNWTEKGEPTEQHDVLVGAAVVFKNGGNKISFLRLKGKRSLFRTADEPVSRD